MGEDQLHPEPVPPVESDLFYMVWGGYNDTPRHRHTDPLAARKESERLAKKHKSKFYVLTTIGFSEPQDAPVKWTDI